MKRLTSDDRTWIQDVDFDDVERQLVGRFVYIEDKVRSVVVDLVEELQESIRQTSLMHKAMNDAYNRGKIDAYTEIHGDVIIRCPEEWFND